MRTLEDLRKLAELNLCKDCFMKYEAMIEPTIKGWLSQPLSDFRQLESQITQLVMKTKGVFKGKMFFISIGKEEEEKYANEVDVKAFREIEKWKFRWKIDYLQKNGVLQDSSYKLLDKAREIRNTVHELSSFSEQDYTLFLVARAITDQIWSATMIEWGANISANLKINAEKFAEDWLKTLQTKPQRQKS